MDLAAATDQLYEGPFDDFIERRKALVAEARAAKDRPLATAIGKLRKPTRSAWLVNLYARQASDELGALLDLGAALQAAQEQLSVADLRRLSGERQKTLAAATRSAVALGEDQGYAATEPVRQEVTQTLQAALADPQVAEEVRAGTVTEAHTYGGFGVFGLGSPPAAPAAQEEAVPADAEPATAKSGDTEQAEAERAEAERAEAERAEAERRLQDAEDALSTAADEAEQATARADELAEQVETLREQLTEAERIESEARQLARTARKAVAEREGDVRVAREAYEAL